MKHFAALLTFTCLNLFSASSSAISVGGFNFADDALADQFLGSSGDFLNYTSATAADVISQEQLAADVTDIDGNTSAATYVLSLDSGAYIDLGFSADVINGEGNDLAFFFAGEATFSLDLLNDEAGASTFTSADTGSDVVDAFGTYALTVALIDLDAYGLGSNASLGDFRINLGDPSRPAFSLAGALNTSITPVPLPAAVWLLLSGMGMFGLIGRRKR